MGGVKRLGRMFDGTAPPLPAPRWQDLRQFLDVLRADGDLLHVDTPVDPHLEATALARRALVEDGPALLCTHPLGHDRHPLLCNLFGSVRRVRAALGVDDTAGVRRIGAMLAFLQAPQMPQGARAMWRSAPQFGRLAHLSPKVSAAAASGHEVWEGDDIDLARLPIQTFWPEDAGPLITWGMVVTRGAHGGRLNLGIYRQQLVGPQRLIMRWLPQRGGARDHADWVRVHGAAPFPVAVVIGADPSTILAAVAPVPDTLSEYQFAGLLRGARTRLERCVRHDLLVPASAEIVLEGHIQPGDTAGEGPFCDHTGYYDDHQPFPVLTVERVRLRDGAPYLSCYSGMPPHDEAAVTATVLGELFVPLLQSRVPDIHDFHLPPAACSYRVAVVSIHKRYAGHARQMMMAVWSAVTQFTYIKYIIVVDDDIDVRDADQVLWAISTRADPVRDTLLVPGTPIDYLDFASPEPGVGGKLGLDATNKWPGETRRTWGRVATLPDEVTGRMDALWAALQASRRPSPAD